MGVNLRFAVHYFVLFAMMGIVLPYVQLFLRARGFSDSQVGYLQGFLALASVAGPLLVGHLADALGRRKLALIAGLVVAAAVLLPLDAASSFVVAAVLLVFLGLFGQTSIPLTDTLASAELSDPAHTYGRVRVWGSIGFVAVLAAAAMLHLVNEKSSTSIMRAMLVTTLACLLSSMLLPDSHRRRTPLAAAAAAGAAPAVGCFDGLFWLFVAVAVPHRLGMSAYYYFFTNYLRDVVHLDPAGWVWAIGPAAEMPMLFFGGRLIRRFGIRALLVVSLASVTVRLAVYAMLPTLWAILPAQLLHAASFGTFHAVSIEFLRRKVPAARRGLAMAIYAGLAVGLPNWLGSSAGGVIVERLGYTTLYLLYAAVPLVGLALLAAGGKRMNLPEPATA
jgi:PPP family 3-phenylpropionic acid transporter